MVRTGCSAVSRLASSLLGVCCRAGGDAMMAESIEVTVLPVPVESVLYYYGGISREAAEWILWERGCRDGLYLLRESSSDYVLSLCFQKSVLHYRIRKLSSGEVGLCGVPRQRFAGPVELVAGVEGLACRPTTPCNRSLDSPLPPTHWGVSEGVVREAVRTKAKEWGIEEDKLTDSDGDAKLLITKTLHEIQPWFHGPLSRVEAERSIEGSGHKDGKFLVRERDDSSYALCLSHSGRIKHYKIDVLPSGEFAIQDGQRFPSIMALVSHYTLFSDGLWCTLREPCPSRRSREQRTTPQGTPSPSRSHRLLGQRGLFSRLFGPDAPPEGNAPLTPPARPRGAKGAVRKASSFDFLPAFLSLFLYGGGASNGEGQPAAPPPVPAPRPSLAKRQAVYANREALGVVGRSASLGEPPPTRAGGGGSTFCRSASSPSVVSQAGLEEGSDAPVPKPRKRPPPPESDASPETSTSPTLTEISEIAPDEVLRIGPEELPTDDVTFSSNSDPPPTPRDPFESVYATLSDDVTGLVVVEEIPRCPEGVLVDLSENDDNRAVLSWEESEEAYLSLRQCRRGTLSLDKKAIDLKEKICEGVFCDVFVGTFTSGPVEVQFAVKKLKSGAVPNPKSEILKEAQMMVALDHPHIVRLIGVSDTNAFMLVMELAPLGPINKYLRSNREVPPSKILVLMVQVASAMEYLESRQFVHRDLAARNVLLVNEGFAKISDFGMSRALGLGKEYYRAESAGKWPLKWYAPECIYYFKFSSKSDVWSFGVTLWEVFSHGDKPYQGMQGRDILRMFENSERLPRPESCPESVYSVIRKCWHYKAEDRPPFSAVHEMLRRLGPL